MKRTKQKSKKQLSLKRFSGFRATLATVSGNQNDMSGDI